MLEIVYFSFLGLTMSLGMLSIVRDLTGK